MAGPDAPHDPASAVPTAAMVCAWRAVAAQQGVHPKLGEPDLLAADFAGEVGMNFADDYCACVGTTTTALAPGMMFRTDFYDAAVMDAVQSGGIKQIVLLGAGFDTRAWRLPLPEDCTIFELDVAKAHELKRERIAEMKAAASPSEKLTMLQAPKCRRVEVEVDLGEAGWAEAHLCGGTAAPAFDRARPAFFLAEGLLMYLPGQAAVERFFREVRSVAAAGSIFAGCSFVGAGILGHMSLYFGRALEKYNCSWTFAHDSDAAVRAMLAEAGFAPTRVQDSAVNWNVGQKAKDSEKASGDAGEEAVDEEKARQLAEVVDATEDGVRAWPLAVLHWAKAKIVDATEEAQASGEGAGAAEAKSAAQAKRLAAVADVLRMIFADARNERGWRDLPPALHARALELAVGMGLAEKLLESIEKVAEGQESAGYKFFVTKVTAVP